MKLKVFVSSTCYDLGIVRSQLRSFIENMGYEPVMSEYDDVVFDPQNHTHTSCINAITKCDVVVLLIGSRYGGEVIPRVIDNFNIEQLMTKSAKSELLEKPHSLSITQCEILKAIESNIPIYTFVMEQVLNDHLFYEKNKGDKKLMGSIKFPSIEKNETASYIFEFINFMRARSENNSYMRFSKIDDIELCLKKQWSGLFQMLLEKSREKKEQDLQTEFMTKQLEDIKALMMSTVQTGDMKDAARGVMQYRSLVLMVDAIANGDEKILHSSKDFNTVLKQCGITEIRMIRHRRLYAPKLYFMKSDNTFFMVRAVMFTLENLKSQWRDFSKLKKSVKEVIIEASRDSARESYIKKIDIDIEEFLNRYQDFPDSEIITEKL